MRRDVSFEAGGRRFRALFSGYSPEGLAIYTFTKGEKEGDTVLAPTTLTEEGLISHLAEQIQKEPIDRMRRLES